MGTTPVLMKIGRKKKWPATFQSANLPKGGLSSPRKLMVNTENFRAPIFLAPDATTGSIVTIEIGKSEKSYTSNPFFLLNFKTF